MNDRMANRQDRADNLQDRISNRGENWQDIRNDWADNAGDRWDDWSENYWDNAHDMNHDHWHDHWDNYWDHMWNEHPVYTALGVTAWGVNRLGYWFGYGGGYSNPYYSDAGSYGGGGYYDYSQPLATYEQVSYPAEQAVPATSSEPVPATAPAGAAPEAAAETSPLEKAYDEARQAFYDSDYPKALEKVNAALALAPNDAALHEFKALSLFALGKYSDAAATIHAVLAVGPGWDWTTFIRMYPAADVYTAQLRALEAAVLEKPKAADLRFLLAYHYITCNSIPAATAQLKEVTLLQPQDTVAQQLLTMLGGPAAAPSTPETAPPKPAGPAAAPAVPKQDLVGVWKAKGQGGSSFELSLNDKSEFKWTFTGKGKSTAIEGVYATEGNSLVLQPDAGGVMVAEVTSPKNGGFHFQQVGAPAGDKGLDFTK
ncbi:tetratricopeptide repeat protein [Planctomyces sp. SH-PL14]|uniref:tetratricopeptide repeat protein n=1 Tax=Planctomyces sp. SH-PL14 TaxID=1632864 RepID=UPI00078E983C|nr:hypothetical protein [Planctomyces sp. SH-PL14]AMV18321.1 hypothetical protein VT03_10555 [Planctomyces sp. SH-PL14]